MMTFYFENVLKNSFMFYILILFLQFLFYLLINLFIYLFIFFLFYLFIYPLLFCKASLELLRMFIDNSYQVYTKKVRFC